jgi:hypothetical protein
MPNYTIICIGTYNNTYWIAEEGDPYTPGIGA